MAVSYSVNAWTSKKLLDNCNPLRYILPMKITVRCTVAGCQEVVDGLKPLTDGELYKSHEFRSAHHRFNAWKKAKAIARAHAEATDHRVNVFGNPTTTVQFVETKCGYCQQHTPGNATGACGPCATREAGKPDAVLI